VALLAEAGTRSAFAQMHRGDAGWAGRGGEYYWAFRRLPFPASTMICWLSRIPILPEPLQEPVFQPFVSDPRMW